jgi:drug/metabolite transporter (DMT)-like permease
VTGTELSLVLVSAALHSVWSVSIKESRDPVLFNWLQMLSGAVVAIVLFAAVPEARSLETPFWGLVVAAGVFHAFYMFWLGRALREGELSLVYPIARSTPVFLPFLAVPLLGERISLPGALGITTVVAGMWLVQTQGHMRRSALRSPAVLFALLTLLATVGYGLTDKAGMSLLHEAVWEAPIGRAVFFFFATTFAGTIFLTPFALRGAAQPVGAVLRAEGGRALAAMAISLASYSLVLEVLRTAQASYVVAVRQSSVLFAVALSWVWLGERPSRARVLGSVVIFAGVALVGLSR